MIINSFLPVKTTQIKSKTGNSSCERGLKADVVSFSGTWKEDVVISDCLEIAKKVFRTEPKKRYEALVTLLIDTKGKYQEAGMQMYYVAMTDGLGDFFIKKHEKDLASTCYAFSSKHALDSGNYKEAIPIYKKSLQIAHDNNDLIHEQARYGKLALCSKRLNQFKQAISYNLEAIVILDKIVNNFDVAAASYRSGSKLQKTAKDYQAERGYLYQQTAYMEFKIGDYKKSVKHYKKALNDFSALNKSNDIKACYLELSRAYKMMGDFQQADATMKKADDY